MKIARFIAASTSIEGRRIATDVVYLVTL